jgi:RNA polymerase sporulation-specific sigma factor
VTIQEAQNNPLFFDKFIEENLRLVHFFVQKFNPGNEYEDYVQIGTIGLIKAVKTFSVDKEVKFATYAAKIITNEILMHIRKNKKHSKETSLDAPISQDVDGNELTLMDMTESDQNVEDDYIEKVETKDKIRELMPRLSGIYRKIFLLHLDGKNQRDIAKSMNLSQSYVSRLISKIEGLGHEIDSNCISEKPIIIKHLGRKEKKTMEKNDETQVKLSKTVAETLIRGGKSPVEIAEEYKHQFSGQPKYVKALLAKWGLIEKKAKSEPGVERVEKPQKPAKKQKAASSILLRAEVMAGKEFKYEMGTKLVIKKGEKDLDCEDLPRMIQELQEINRIRQEAV